MLDVLIPKRWGGGGKCIYAPRPKALPRKALRADHCPRTTVHKIGVTLLPSTIDYLDTGFVTLTV